LSDAEHAETVRSRSHETAERMAGLERSRREAFREEVRAFLEPEGDERVLDVGAGTGGFALAVAPLVGEVVAVDAAPEVVAVGREQAEPFPNVTFVEGDAMRLSFPDGSFDVAAAVRTLHHVPRPELVVAELARVTSYRGRLLIVDQVAPTDPMIAFELDRFERARDPSHTRLLPDVDIRSLLDANSLVLRRAAFHQEERDLERYLDLAGCGGEERDRVLALAPCGYSATIGWYLAVRPQVSD
jgi:ubiquinone/menaquinone biosynthesis C-methylase UbiE